MKKKVVLFGPGRTGSTLVYNVLRDLEGVDVEKRHNLTPKQIHQRLAPNTLFISTIRDWRDVLCSRARIYDTPITAESIQSIAKEMNNTGLGALTGMLSNPALKGKVLVLRYEDFWNNYDALFDSLESGLGCTIGPEKRAELKAKHNVNAVKKIADRFDGFAQYDKVTQVHGNHISDNNGQPDAWRKVIAPELHPVINKALAVPLKFYGYL